MGSVCKQNSGCLQTIHEGNMVPGTGCSEQHAIMHLEMRFIMDADIVFGSNPFKVHSQACFKDLLAISSLVLVKCFYFYVDQGWLEQTRC